MGSSEVTISGDQTTSFFAFALSFSISLRLWLSLSVFAFSSFSSAAPVLLLCCSAQMDRMAVYYH